MQGLFALSFFSITLYIELIFELIFLEEEEDMRKIFILMLFSWVVICSAFQVDVFGPEADDFNCANLNQEPASFGTRINEQEKLCLWENGEWNNYSYYVNGLPVISTCMLNADTMLVAMGAMTFSDGIYNFDIHTHTWQLNDWFMLPNFVKFIPIVNCIMWRE